VGAVDRSNTVAGAAGPDAAFTEPAPSPEPPAAPPPTEVPPGAAGAGRASGPLPVYGPASSKVFNPDIAVIGDFLGAIGKNDSDRATPSLELHETEASFQAIVDPYARADFFLVFAPSEVGVEEGFVTFTSLPANFLVRSARCAVVRQGQPDAQPRHAVDRSPPCHAEPGGRRRGHLGRRHLGEPAVPQRGAVPGGDGGGVPGESPELFARRPEVT